MKQNKFWDTRSKKYDSAIIKRDIIFLKTTEKCKSFLNKSDTLLDFGCASGEYSIALVNTVNSIIGIDTSEEMIALAKCKLSNENRSTIRFYSTDIMDSRLEPKSFNTILAFSVLHLLKDIPKVLKKLHDLLSDGGIIISQTPCLSERSFLFKTFVSIAQKLGIAPYIKSLKYSDLEILFEQNGFEIVESRSWDKRNSIRWIVLRKMTNTM